MIVRLLVVLSALLLAVPAHAEDARARARVRYESGMAHYNVGQFDAAIDDFRQAYELTHAPALLFNLAQASRLAKRNEEALRFYRSYLRAKPNAANRRDAEIFIDQLEKLVAAPPPAPPSAPVEPQLVTPPPPAPEPPPAAVVSAPRPVPTLAVTPRPLPPPRPASPRPWVIAAAVVGGVGLAGFATGVAFATFAAADANQITREAAQNGVWTDALQRTWDDGHRDQTIATALLVAGGVTTAVGVVLAVVAARKASVRRFAVTPTPGGAGLGWSCDF